MENFCLTVQYDKNSTNPEHIFYGTGKFLEALKAFDKDVVRCIDSDIEPTLLLEDVQNGSIKIWLRNIIASIPDEGLGELDAQKIIGGYLVKAKYILVDYLSKNNTVENEESLKELTNTITDAAKETGLNSLGIYSPPPRKELLEHISMMGNAFSHFSNNEKIYFQTTDDNKIMINSNFRLPRENIEEFCQGETIENTSIALLKVRKPDFLGNSKWAFRYGSKTIDAKMLDVKWLQDYKERKFAVYPGDALKVKMKTIAVYGRNSELVSENHEVLEVIEIVPDNPIVQADLFQEKN
ncbi:MAG: hypothetical protein IKN12_12045 [Selenomonadaceae bacterium]|nr:hypothetical protein [Selenomonadaceae bacterium]